MRAAGPQSDDDTNHHGRATRSSARAQGGASPRRPQEEDTPDINEVPGLYIDRIQHLDRLANHLYPDTIPTDNRDRELSRHRKIHLCQRALGNQRNYLATPLLIESARLSALSDPLGAN